MELTRLFNVIRWQFSEGRDPSAQEICALPLQKAEEYLETNTGDFVLDDADVDKLEVQRVQFNGHVYDWHYLKFTLLYEYGQNLC